MKYLLLLAFAGLAWGCNNNKGPGPGGTPTALDFVLLDQQGNNLLVSTTTPVKVSSTNSQGQVFFLGLECAGGGCTMIRPANRSSTGTPKYDFYYSSLGASLASSAGSKTWYIELGGKTDTLYYDVQNGGKKTVVFNGQVARQEDPAQPPLYVFRRKR